jgi:hypothetical protein
MVKVADVRRFLVFSFSFSFTCVCLIPPERALLYPHGPDLCVSQDDCTTSYFKRQIE